MLPLIGKQISAAAGAETSIAISRNFISKLESPHGYCVKNVDKNSEFSSFFFNYIVNTLGVDYTQKHCFSLCMQNEIIKYCGCTNLLMPVFNLSSRYCISYIELDCMLNIATSFDEKDAAGDCENACPFECDSIDYEISSFTATYPNSVYKSTLLLDEMISLSNISYEDIGRAVVKVNVFYESMDYKKTEEKVLISSDVFFSNIGGTLGLCMGVSVLSFVEIFELVYLLVYSLVML